MFSVVLFIASGIVIIAGIGLFVFNYAPYIANFWNSLVSAYDVFTSLVPDFLLPFIGIPLFLAFVGLLIKLL